jgi:hypothetical protein
MITRSRIVPYAFVLGALGLAAVTPGSAAPLSIARIYIEYNESGNDLGFHVFLDAEDWVELEIRSPAGATIFEVEGSGGYAELGLTELFFEGAEPSLADVPLATLLAMFPQGRYKFIAETVDGATLVSRPLLSHAVPAGPVVSADVEGDDVVIAWEPVTSAPPGFPVQAVNVVAYQVIVGSFQVTLPRTATEVALPEAFVDALGTGEHDFEVLAIEASGNQTITEGTFTID